MEKDRAQSASSTGIVTNWMSPEDKCRNERRQYWLWATAIVITLLLTLAAASLAFTILHTQGELFYFLDTRQVVKALLSLVLLFNVYVVYQQIQNRRICRLLDEQNESSVRTPPT